MKRLWPILVVALALPCSAQTVFNCSSFVAGSGTCGASTSNNTNGGNNFKLNGNHGSVVSGVMQLAPAGTSHSSLNALYTTKVNTQAFTTTYTFVPSGNTIAFGFQNTTNQTGFQGLNFAAGAGCEGGIFQAKNVGVGAQSPNFTFGILMDGYNNLNPNVFGPGPNGFTFSNTQVVQSTQDPCKPNDSDPNYWASNGISTSPVSLNSPSNTPNTTTGHVYSVTINYDGTNLTENMFDVTAGGTCSPVTSGTCYHQVWTAINIPSIVGANTAYVMITGSTISAGNVAPVQVNSWSYTTNTPSSSAVTSTYTSAAGSGLSATFATAPTFAPVAGSYGTAQTVTITSAGSSNICYVLSATQITAGNALAPAPDNQGHCAVGTSISSGGTVSVSSTQYLYAMAGLTYTGLPSNLTSGLYTIGAAPPPPTTAGLLTSARALNNWSNAGAGTIPPRTTIYASLTSSTTPAIVASTLASCTAGDTVLLGAGTYTWPSSLIIQSSNCTLRGAGPLSTILKFTGTTTNCSGIGPAAICVYNGDSGSISSAGNIVPWTSGYTAGTTSITLGTATRGSFSNLKIGSLMVLAQCDQGFSGTNCVSGSATDNGQWWNCGVQGVCTWGGSDAVFKNAGQAQIVTVTGIAGSTVSFTPAIYAPNWSSSLSPFVWYSSTLPVAGFGLENLTVDTQSLGSIDSMIDFMWVAGSWIKNVRMDNNAVAASSARLHAVIQSSTHITVRDSYMYGGSPSSDDYGIDFQWGTSDSLAENNISQHLTTGYIVEGAGQGNVFGYNYAVDDFFGGGWQIVDSFSHDEGDAYTLFEGQEGIGYEQDNAHATSDMLTYFRSYASGYDPVTQCPGGGLACYNYPSCGGTPCPTPPKNQHLMAVELQATNRYSNVFFNVLGSASNDTTYQNQGASGNPNSCPGYPEPVIYSLNFANSNQVPYSPTCVGASITLDNDPLVSGSPGNPGVNGTLARWGNYDAQTGTVRTVSGETGSSASTYPGLATPSTSYGSYKSLYLSVQPPFWGSQPWPAVGPDITGGNIANAGGHAYHNPAAICYLQTLGGKVDGSSGILNFDATTCYGSAPPPNVCQNPFQSGPNYSGTYTCTGTSCSYSGGGVYTLPIVVAFTNPTAACTMHMTLDGSTPTSSSPAYAQQSISSPSTVTMRVGAFATGFTSSAIEGGGWTVVNSTPASPTINVTIGPGVKIP
jgi:hypothetical protein